MTISTHTLLDIVVAVVTTVGIAVAVSLALMAAGSLHQRAQLRGATPRRGDAGSAPHPTQTDAGRDLVLR
jgi:hypothetical protein